MILLIKQFIKSKLIKYININKEVMDWEVREIEKYYLEKKDPKFLYKHVEHMTPEELRDIVRNNIININKIK